MWSVHNGGNRQLFVVWRSHFSDKDHVQRSMHGFRSFGPDHNAPTRQCQNDRIRQSKFRQLGGQLPSGIGSVMKHRAEPATDQATSSSWIPYLDDLSCETCRSSNRNTATIALSVIIAHIIAKFAAYALHKIVPLAVLDWALAGFPAII